MPDSCSTKSGTTATSRPANDASPTLPTPEAPVEHHPLRPFLPEEAKVLMLGSFPPPQKRWSIDFSIPTSKTTCGASSASCFTTTRTPLSMSPTSALRSRRSWTSSRKRHRHLRHGLRRKTIARKCFRQIPRNCRPNRHL